MFSISVLLFVLVVLINLLVLPYFVFLLLLAITSFLTSIARKRAIALDPKSRFLIVVPAHDEETGIAETVRSCLSFDYPASLFELNVIADNCTDATAAVARQAGSKVVERFDAVKKSKGYAIEYLLESLESQGRFDDYTAYIIIDADTVADPGLLRAFDRELAAGHDWLQAYYTVSNPGSSWRTRLMTYAFSLMNGVALAGQNAIGLSAGFRGNGMCFSSRGLRRFPFRTYGLVEDIEYSWELRIAGEWIKFVPDTFVAGAMVSSSKEAAVSQRKRWEFGRSELKRSKRGQIWRAPKLNPLVRIGSLLELTMPTMVQLAAIYLVLTVLNLASAGFLGLAIPPIAFWLLISLQAIMTLSMGLYALSPFFVLGLPWRFALSLGAFPFYAVWKTIAARGGKPREWVRTARGQ